MTRKGKAATRFIACLWDDVAIRRRTDGTTPKFCSPRCEAAWMVDERRKKTKGDTNESRTPPEFVTWTEPAGFDWAEAREAAREDVLLVYARPWGRGGFARASMDDLTEREEELLQRPVRGDTSLTALRLTAISPWTRSALTPRLTPERDSGQAGSHERDPPDS